MQLAGSEAEPRRCEAGLSAALARTLLGSARIETALEDASTRLATALGLPWARILLDPPSREEGEADQALTAEHGGPARYGRWSSASRAW